LDRHARANEDGDAIKDFWIRLDDQRLDLHNATRNT
jgi:hypothetical protein